MTNKIDTEELLANESFINWVRSGNKDNQWQEIWQDPVNEPVVEEARQIIYSIKIKSDDPSLLTKKRIRDNIYLRIKPTVHRENHYQKKEKVFLIRKAWYAAAIIAFLLTAGISVFYLDHQGEEIAVEQQWITKSTAPGQKLTVFLPDGSYVKLNADTEIKYIESFKGEFRRVILNGEAFFEVEEDVHKPFIVKSREISTKVLGTSFNVKCYDGEDRTSVVLKTGRVEISRVDNSKQRLYLEPGSKADFIRNEQKLVKENANMDDLLWKDDIILFRNASRKEVFKKLENWYGVSFDLSGLSSGEDDWNYSGRFEGKSLENVLKSISFVQKFSYEINNDEIIIH